MRERERERVGSFHEANTYHHANEMESEMERGGHDHSLSVRSTGVAHSTSRFLNLEESRVVSSADAIANRSRKCMSTPHPSRVVTILCGL